MHVGIMSGHFKRPSLEESLDAIRALDIKHLQFNMASAHLNGPIEEEIESAGPHIREQLDKRDMVIAALGGPVNMVHVDPEKRQQAIDRMAVLIAACEHVGTSVIATCTGSRDPESMWRFHPDNASEATWQVLCSTLEQVLPIAEGAGVTIAFEPEFNNVASDAKTSRRLIDDMRSPNLKVVMDAANIFGENDLSRMTEVLDEAFELLGEHTVVAHGKDLDHGGDAGHLAAGTGKLDYDHYVKLLCGLPNEVAVILHGLSEEEVPGAAAMLRGYATKHQVS